MKIATWNVNSIRARHTRVLEWIRAQRPDVLCLQETKVTDADFPTEEFRALGYHMAVHGQKTYNGVAILAGAPLVDVVPGFDDGVEDQEARLLGASAGGVRVYSLYVPNGKIVGSAAYAAKLLWLERVRGLLARRHRPTELLALCGDFNIAPEERDVHDPAFWQGQVLFHPTARQALGRLCEFGLVDTLRLHHAEGGLYSWWDYRQLAFPKNAGVRIDHVLASRALAERCQDAWIDREARKGPTPSDHAPVVAVFDLPPAG